LIKFSSPFACPKVYDCSQIPQPDQEGHYDLTKLISNTPRINAIQGFSTFSISVCKNSLACGFCKESGAGYCEFYDSGEFQFTDCIGKFAGARGLFNGEGVELVYTGGDFGGNGRLKIFCDPNAPTVPVPIIHGNGKLISFSSRYACPALQTDCTKVTQPDADGHYDLTRLLARTPQIDAQVGYSKFSVEICKDSLSCGFCHKAGYCEFYDSGQFQFTDCIGKYSGIRGLSGGKGVEIFYEGGDMGSIGRVVVSCDPNAPPTPVPVIGESGNLMTFASPYACPAQK